MIKSFLYTIFPFIMRLAIEQLYTMLAHCEFSYLISKILLTSLKTHILPILFLHLGVLLISRMTIALCYGFLFLLSEKLSWLYNFSS